MIIMKAWQWQRAGKIKSANLWIFCEAVCMILSGLIGVLTVGFVCPHFEMMFMLWDMGEEK